jgi:hypothetical protein
MTLSIHRIYGIVIFLIAGSVLLSAICQLCFVLVDGAPDFVTLRLFGGRLVFSVQPWAYVTGLAGLVFLSLAVCLQILGI